MRKPSRTWQWQCNAPLRADAESVFVPCSEIPDANVGDAVIVSPHSGDPSRTGSISAWTEGGDEMFFRLTLEP